MTREEAMLTLTASALQGMLAHQKRYKAPAEISYLDWREAITIEATELALKAYNNLREYHQVYFEETEEFARRRTRKRGSEK